jgi:hypothetical protein
MHKDEAVKIARRDAIQQREGLKRTYSRKGGKRGKKLDLAVFHTRRNNQSL